MTASLTDARGRPMRDLRISVTDRCNFRCTYCMPREFFGAAHPFLDRGRLLDFEEIGRLARIARSLGVEKIRLTGGEPTLRRDLDRLVAMLARIPGLDLALTTNGSRLAALAAPLARAGLHRVSVSLDALDDETFGKMNDVGFPVARVLEGIEAAAAAGLKPVKINSVIRRSVNLGGALPLARHFRGTGHILRFIEYMDAGNTNGWRNDEVVPSSELVARIGAEWPIEPVEPGYPGEVAERWRYRDGAGEIGFVSSVSRAFCRSCTRARISAEGKLFTCLFAATGTDLRTLMRSGASDDRVRRTLAEIWRARDGRYSETRTPETASLPKVDMSYIGG